MFGNIKEVKFSLESNNTILRADVVLFNEKTATYRKAIESDSTPARYGEAVLEAEELEVLGYMMENFNTIVTGFEYAELNLLYNPE